MPRVLIVEDEPMLRASMARGIGKLPGIEVAEAGSLEEALRAIDEQAPRLVLSDIDLPDRSGIEILGELGRRGIHVPVVFISAYLSAYRSQIPPHADVEVREKPISLEDLRRLVTERTGVLGTEAAPFTAADYLQLSCLGRHSVRIEVEMPEGGLGRITVRAGEVWAAADREGTGVAAFERVVLAPPGRVECRTLREDAGPRDVHGDWERLLLEAARRADEARASGRQAQAMAPPDEAPAAESPAAPAGDGEFEAAWNDGVEALLAKDYAAALRCFRTAARARPEDGRVRANLDRLRVLGYTED